MHKLSSRNSKLCGGSVTRLTGRREYVHVGLTAAFPVADTCQSSHRIPFPIVEEVTSCSFLTTERRPA
ncbi:hypothetical protein [Methylotuvimicrobium sp.]|uniref:hypothetical protein n=1 Tax=Methylotuvimicrobium sp. TaxID=2822413 RepID=UPI003D646709